MLKELLLYCLLPVPNTIIFENHDHYCHMDLLSDNSFPVLVYD